MADVVEIPSEEKRRGWRRFLWGYTYVQVPRDPRLFEVDAIPGIKLFAPGLVVGYVAYTDGWEGVMWLTIFCVGAVLLGLAWAFAPMLTRVLREWLLVRKWRREVRRNGKSPAGTRYRHVGWRDDEDRAGVPGGGARS